MSNAKKIQEQGTSIAIELYEWAETFAGERDDEGEPTLETYNFVWDLAHRLQNNQCTEQDYIEIEFHIWQINQDEERIIL